MTENIETLCSQISNILIQYGNSGCDYIKLSTNILGSDLSGLTTISYLNEVEFYHSLEFDDLISLMNLITSLKDDMLKLTGDEIWGLTFTLYPDGKFEIEYNYDKPEDYEETDEVITGEEIKQTFLK